MLQLIVQEKKMIDKKQRAQWLSGRVLDPRPRGRGFEPHQRHCIVSLSKKHYPSLVLPKTRPCLFERLLIGRKDSNKQKTIYLWKNKKNTLISDSICSNR